MTPAAAAAAAILPRRHRLTPASQQLSDPERGFRHPNDIASTDDKSLQSAKSVFVNG